MTSEKVRENRLRRVALRRGWKLTRSRRRDPLATDYGQWRLAHLHANTSDRVFYNLDDVEAFLEGGGMPDGVRRPRPEGRS